MVSLPAIKSLMLQASRLLKGASVADRIYFCGVPCFILSKDPAPELAAALQRQAKHRSGVSAAALSQLSTIAETEIHPHSDEATSLVRRKSFAGSCGRYRQRDVILHLTGGGFFAHTIASDLPYLLDWSSSTGAVVVCPEYALLPENHFPVALEQIAKIYSALASGDTGPHLGFEVNRICVTGESAGGNLAAALCVKLAMHNMAAATASGGADDTCQQPPPPALTSTSPPTGDPPAQDRSHRMPDAIMLSCPALNLTTELSHSRVVGTEDPVLPSGLLSAISEAYAPAAAGDDGGGLDKRDPLVSPFFASDAVLQWFPPALLFASSNDPLLDDSVTFNERLRVAGVSSELIAVHNVPHAYLGLGTAGFPEAVQVQKHAVEFLSSKLRD
jgi:monoterpene epsilon-lactone hydrolase